MESLSYTIKRHRLGEKLCYVLSVASMCLLTYGVTSAPYIMPYIFTAMVPLLAYSCLIMTGSNSLLHTCHLTYTIFLIFIWFMPQNAPLFAFLFTSSNGPILWSLIVFNNALVLHNKKHMTYVFMHILGSLLCSVIRWYPKESSKFWHQEFMPQSFDFSYTWLIAVPFAMLKLQRVIHVLVENWLVPTERHYNLLSFAMTRKNNLITRFIKLAGPKHIHLMFHLIDSVVSLLVIMMSIFMYNSFLWNCFFICLALVMTAYNGAFYYLNVFSAKDRDWYLRSINAEKEKQGH